MSNIDFIILTIFVSFLYMGFAFTLFFAQKKQQSNEDIRKEARSIPILQKNKR